MKKCILLIILLLCFGTAQAGTRYSHILITNDDGIEDADRLIALAGSVSSVADRVSIIVPATDRSGSSNHTLYGKHQSTFEVTCIYRDEDKNITAYTLPANPADCVLIGLSGFFGEDRPDLVLSGINGGPNIGPGWFGSGTVGAARTAAFLGVRAIAFSGFNDDIEKSFTIIPGWIAKFISSGFIEEMGKDSYLTVGFPRIPFEEMKGVKIADRRISYDNPELVDAEMIHGGDPHDPDNTTIWVLKGSPDMIDRDALRDDQYLHQGYVVITPMTIDENDGAMLERLLEKAGIIPAFP